MVSWYKLMKLMVFPHFRKPIFGIDTQGCCLKWGAYLGYNVVFLSRGRQMGGVSFLKSMYNTLCSLYTTEYIFVHICGLNQQRSMGYNRPSRRPKFTSLFRYLNSKGSKIYKNFKELFGENKFVFYWVEVSKSFMYVL